MKTGTFVIGGVAITAAFFIKLFYAIGLFFILLFLMRQGSLLYKKATKKKSLWDDENKIIWQ